VDGRGPTSQSTHRADERGGTWHSQESRLILRGRRWPLGAPDRGQLSALDPRPADSRDPLRVGVESPFATSVASRATSGGTARLGQEVSKYFPRRALEVKQVIVVLRRVRDDSSHGEGTCNDPIPESLRDTRTGPTRLNPRPGSPTRK
jgi:hypothetical protein